MENMAVKKQRLKSIFFMVVLTGSVGNKGENKVGEIKKIQNLLNKNRHLIPTIKKLSEDGKIGEMTINAIIKYQKNILKMLKPDGRIDPNGKTLRNLNNNARKQRPANVEAFVNKILNSAKIVNKKYRVPVSVIIAQAALESGWGNHVKGNSYFGIKAHNTHGSITSFQTTEFVNGKKISISDPFRAYKDFNEAALDYGKFLTMNPRYNIALTHKNNPEKFADMLQKAGYATDPQYAKKIKNNNFYLWL